MIMSELFKISTMTFESGWSMGDILSNDDFVAVAQGSYGDRLFVSKAGVTTVNLAENELKGYWQRYCSRMEYGYTKMYDALIAQYNAIENYDRTEDTKTVNSGKDTTIGVEKNVTEGTTSGNVNTSSTNSDSSSDTTDGTEISKNQNSNDTLHKVSGYNDVDTMTSDSADNVSGSTSNDVTTHTNVVHSNNGGSSGTSSTSGNSKISDSGDSSSIVTHGHEIAISSRVHGNIGVTTNQQMIISELELRKFDLQFEIVKRFLDMYTIYWD